jgi:hypothetical protein
LGAGTVSGHPTGGGQKHHDPGVLFKILRIFIDLFFTKLALLKLEKQCCGSGMFIADPTFFHPGSEFFHPESRIRIPIKNLSILTQKNGF